jgi:hypothetical protein
MSTLWTGTAMVLSFSAELAQFARASEPEPVVTPLMKKDLADVPGREMLMIVVDYPPRSGTHPSTRRVRLAQPAGRVDRRGGEGWQGGHPDARTERCPRGFACRITRLHSARRNEDDGCQIVEVAVTRRALSTRSCAGRSHVGAASPRKPTSNTTTRRAESIRGCIGGVSLP